MSNSSADNLNSLLTALEQLHFEERHALDLLAVMYAPVSRSTFAQCLQKAGIRSVQDRIMNPANVQPLIEKLAAGRLLLEKGSGYVCNPQPAHLRYG